MLLSNKIKLLPVLWFVLAGLLAPAAVLGAVHGNLAFPPVPAGADQKYLGVGSGSFKLNQIATPYVVLEVMRTNCPHCQEQSPCMNKFYHLVQGSDLKGKVRFLAVAQSSSAGEVREFKKAHGVPFPVVPDPNSTVGGALHIKGVPTVFILKRDGQILRTGVGGFDSPKAALAELRKLVK
jgi:peroxiredoxin